MELDTASRLHELRERLAEQDDMESYCRVSNDVGATYYKEPIYCPEVIRFHLLVHHLPPGTITSSSGSKSDADNVEKT